MESEEAEICIKEEFIFPTPVSKESTWEETMLADLIKRQISVLKTYNCSLCKEHITDYEEALTHYLNHSFDKQKENNITSKNLDECGFHRCSKCLMGFLIIHELDHHEKYYHNELIFMCAVCNKCFAKEIPFISHMELHRPNFEGFGNLKLNDTPEQPSLASLKKLDIKIARQNTGYSCVVCKNFVSTYYPMLDHYKKHSVEKRNENLNVIMNNENDSFNEFCCRTCLQECENKTELEDHQTNYHKKYAFMCPICNKCFSKEGSMFTHIETHSPDYEPLKCAECGFTTVYPWAFSQHTNMHPKLDNPFQCDKCNESFVLKKDVLAHNRKMHQNNVKTKEPVKCPDCDKEFPLKSAWKKHYVVHTGEPRKKVVCDICGKSVAYSSYNVHRKRHTGEKPHACNICDKRFTTPTALNDHMRTHDGQKPFVCEHCGKGFTQKTSLTIHTRLHTGEKPYKCVICNKCFVSKSTLGLHMKQGKHGFSSLSTNESSMNDSSTSSSEN